MIERCLAGARSPGLLCAPLAAAVFCAFSPTLHNGFVGYDDPEYVTANPHVRGGLTRQNAGWAFTAVHASNWHPLTWLSHMLDVTLFGLDPAGHHLSSLLLHIANTLLLFLLLRSETRLTWRSAFVAAAFGLHPLRVESVAWVAERKDVLSAAFWLLTMLAYGRYARQGGRSRYALVVGLFALGLLAKPMVVSLPLVLLLWDLWPLSRHEGGRAPGRTALLIEKVPFLALAAVSGVVTIAAQRQGVSLLATEVLPLRLRIANAAFSSVRYLGQTAWPSGLAAFYPHPAETLTAATGAAAFLLLLLLSVLALAARRPRPWLTVGWFWYVVTLLPVSGLVQVGLQGMADRYTYLPTIGLLIVASWAGASAARRSRAAAHVVSCAAVAALVALSVASWRQVQVWRSGLTLWEHALAVTSANFVAHDNLGVELDRRGRSAEAIAHYRSALRIRPGDRNSEHNYASALFAKGVRDYERGALDDALGDLSEGLRHEPQSALARSYRGSVLAELGRPNEAIPELRRAIAIDPRLARAHKALGTALAASGRLSEAARAFEAAAQADAADAGARYGLGVALASLGRNQEALAAYDAALRLRPDLGLAHADRALVLSALGRYREAWDAVAAARVFHVEPDRAFLARLGRRLPPPAKRRAEPRPATPAKGE